MSEPKQFTIFKNSFVYILTDSLKVVENKMGSHIVISGFLTDYDHKDYFLSVEPMGDITDSVRIDSVIRMFLPIDELSAMLESQGNSGDLN